MIKMVRARRRPVATPAVRSLYLQVEGRRLHALVAGRGSPLVLIHGFSASSRWWRRNIVALAQQHQVYALDITGFGRSWPKHHFSLEQAVSLVPSWMDAVGIPTADFCGHSMGGQLCIRLAAAAPERVKRLILVDASGLPLNAHLLPLAWRSVRSSGQTRFTFAPTVVGSALVAGPLVLWAALRDLLADDVRADLARISAPTLIVWGERDVLVPLEYGHALHGGIYDSRLEIVAGAGHNVMYEAAPRFNRLVLDFLNE